MNPRASFPLAAVCKKWLRLPKEVRARIKNMKTKRSRRATTTKKAETTKSKALNLVMQNILLKCEEGNYKLYDTHVSEFRSDVKGALGLRAANKELATHDAKPWMDNMVFCIAENLEEARMADPEGPWAIEAREDLARCELRDAEAEAFWRGEADDW